MAPTTPGPVEIHFGMTNGTVHRFVQPDHFAFAKFLVLLQPAKVFTTTQIVMAGSNSMHGFHVSGIERLDLLVDSLPDYWTAPPHLVQTEELTRTEFENIVGTSPHGDLKISNAAEGDIVPSYAEIELASGNRAYVRLHIRVRNAIEQKNTIQHLLSQSAMWFRRADRGFVLLNVANIVRYGLYPGPAVAPATAWPMERF